MTKIECSSKKEKKKQKLKYMEQPPAPCYWSKIIVPLKAESLHGDTCDIDKVTCLNCSLVFYFRENYHASFDFENVTHIILKNLCVRKISGSELLNYVSAILNTS